MAPAVEFKHLSQSARKIILYIFRLLLKPFLTSYTPNVLQFPHILFVSVSNARRVNSFNWRRDLQSSRIHVSVHELHIFVSSFNVNWITYFISSVYSISCMVKVQKEASSQIATFSEAKISPFSLLFRATFFLLTFQKRAKK